MTVNCLHGQIQAAACVVAALSLSVPVATDRVDVVDLAFLAFETCVGFYYPTMAVLKAELVGDDTRAAVYSLYRVPLNAVVVAVLLADVDSRRTQFAICAGLLALAAAAAACLARVAPRKARPDREPNALTAPMLADATPGESDPGLAIQ